MHCAAASCLIKLDKRALCHLPGARSVRSSSHSPWWCVAPAREREETRFSLSCAFSLFACWWVVRQAAPRSCQSNSFCARWCHAGLVSCQSIRIANICFSKWVLRGSSSACRAALPIAAKRQPAHHADTLTPVSPSSIERTPHGPGCDEEPREVAQIGF